MQFKGSFDFKIDSDEFLHALKIHFKLHHNIDNPSGKILIYYWVQNMIFIFYFHLFWLGKRAVQVSQSNLWIVQSRFACKLIWFNQSAKGVIRNIRIESLAENF